TLRYLSERYSGDRLFLLMGSDMFLTFREWRDWRGIGELVTLLVVSREADDAKPLIAQQGSLAADGIISQILKNPITPLSSTQLRAMLAKGKGYDCVPWAVAHYIKAQGLYGCGYNLSKLRETVKPLLSSDRYHHSLCVEKQAIHLAQLYGADENQAAAAGILHDVCKNMPAWDLLQMLNNSDTMYDIDFEAQPQLLHGYAGALYIQKNLGITDEDVINAVRYHTTARRGMSRLERIIYLADITSEERSYPDVAVMRSLAERSQEEAMLYALSYITGDLARRGLAVCNVSQEALAEYQSIGNKNKLSTKKMEETK
ncbi:MAG: bis(5'-nucleosyl)-tetraphosphatase (symmetrical) YqeK, partial [Angelakisella sp.]